MNLKTTLLLSTTLLLCACSAAQQFLDTLGDRPSAQVAGVQLRNIGLDKATLAFDIEVSNPYTFALPLADIGFNLATGGQEFLSGTTEVAGSIPTQGKQTVALPLDVSYRGLLGIARDVRPGQVVPYTAGMQLHLKAGDTPLTLPVEHSGELPIPNVPSVSVGEIEWGEVSLSSVTGELSLEVGNTNEFPFSLDALAYDLSLADSRIADGQRNTDLDLDPGETGALKIPLSFSPGNAGLALLNVIRGEEADYDLGGSLTMQTPFGPMDLPFRTKGTASQVR